MVKIKRFTILNVLDTTINNLWAFCKAWKVVVPYVLVMAFISAVSGNWSHTCKDSLSISWWCPSVSNAYTAYAMIAFYYISIFVLCCAFIYDIYNEAFGTEKSGFESIIYFKKPKLRFMLFFSALSIVFFANLAICIWLVFRKADPNWLVELRFFLIAFFLATVDVLILRTSASIGMFLQNNKIPDFMRIFRLTHGKFYVVLITFCALNYFVSLLQMEVMGFLELLNIKKTYFYVAVSTEVFSCLTKFGIFAVYIAYFVALAQILDFQNKDNVSEKTEIMPKEETVNTVENKKSANKKKKVVSKTTKKATKTKTKKKK